MKKINLLLMASTLTLGLFSCGDPDDGRSRELAPTEGQKIETKTGIGKLSKAVETMADGTNALSASLSKTSTFSISGTSSSSYNDDPTRNATYTYDIAISKPLFDVRGIGLSGNEAKSAKASLFLGGDFKGTLQKDGVGNENNINALNAALSLYLNDGTFYVDPTKAKNIIKQVAVAASGNSNVGLILEGLLRDKYKVVDAISDVDMPLVSSSFVTEIDNYLSLFSENAEAYKDFLNLSEKDGNYSFYLTLTKEDLIRILDDSQNKYADKDSSDYNPIDFSAEFKDSVVNAFELLITFNESAVLSADFNIDMNMIGDSDIATSSEVVGTVESDNHFIGKGKIEFGATSPAKPVDSDFIDGKEAVSKIDEALKKAGVDISEIIGSII